MPEAYEPVGPLRSDGTVAVPSWLSEKEKRRLKNINRSRRRSKAQRRSKIDHDVSVAMAKAGYGRQHRPVFEG